MTTALVVCNPWRVNVRRRPTLGEAMAIARAFADGDFTGEMRCVHNAAKMMPDAFARSLTRPGLKYATLRDYLMDEHDVDPRVAAACALHFTAPLRYTA